MFWVLLTLSFACADKLDRTYLPPPGSKYAGGRPEDIQIPFEYSGIKYPENPIFPHNEEIAIGIERKGPKNTLNIPQSIKSKIIPVNYDYFTRSSIVSDAIPKYSSSESPDIGNLQNKENGQQTEIQNKSENFLSSNHAYPKQTANENLYANTFRPTMKNEYVSTSLPNTENPIDGDLDSLVILPCNSSLTNGFNKDPCIVNSNDKQYPSTIMPTLFVSTTLSPTTIIPSYSEHHDSNQPHKVNSASATGFYSTTKRPLISFDIKRPERIQAKSDREAIILNYDNILTPEGFAYSFDTSNGIHGDESGIALQGVRAKGSYSYIGDDGKVYHVSYTADENGFRPKGDHLPTPPPIPDAILKVIEKAYEDKKAGVIDDGTYDEHKYGYKKYQKNYNKLNPFKTTNEEMKINEYLNSDNLSLRPKGQNVSSKYLKNKQNNEPIYVSEQASFPEHSSNYYDSKNLSTKPISNNIDNEYKKNIFITNNNEKYNERNNLSPIIDSHLYNQSGYPYYSFQNQKELPTHFSKTYNNENQKNQVSPTTSIAPLVSQSDDDKQQNYDSRKALYDKPRYYSNNEIREEHNNNNNPTDGSNIREGGDNTKDFIENDDFKSTHNGYYYPQAINSDELSNQQSSDPNVSQASVYGPFEFSTRSSTIPEAKYYSGQTETSFRSSTNPSSTETSMVYQTSIIPSYSTRTYENGYGETKEPTYFINNGLLPTEKNIDMSMPKFATSYSPNIDIMNSDTFKFPSSTEKVFGEDFSGPKRPQSFNPITGYQY